MRFRSTKATLAALVAVLFLLVMAGIIAEYARERSGLRAHAAAATGGDPRRGEALFIQYGCGSCHALKNVRTATGMVGPPLDGIATRVIVAGRFANNPDNMQRWIRDPQHASPGTAMPDLDVSQGDARDITAFLYTRTK
jgi:cytochrome c2